MTQAVRKMACFHFFQEKPIFYIVTQIVFWKKLLIKRCQKVIISKPQLPIYLNFMILIVIDFGNTWDFFWEFFNEIFFSNNLQISKKFFFIAPELLYKLRYIIFTSQQFAGWAAFRPRTRKMQKNVNKQLFVYFC